MLGRENDEAIAAENEDRIADKQEPMNRREELPAFEGDRSINDLGVEESPAMVAGEKLRYVRLSRNCCCASGERVVGLWSSSGTPSG